MRKGKPSYWTEYNRGSIKDESPKMEQGAQGQKGRSRCAGRRLHLLLAREAFELIFANWAFVKFLH